MFAKLTRNFAIFALAVSATSSAFSQEAPKLEPGDFYTKGYMEFIKGDKMLQEGNLLGALNPLRKAQDEFDLVARRFPDWNPEMVDYRRRAVRELVADTEDKIRRVRPVDIGPEPSPPGKVPPVVPVGPMSFEEMKQKLTEARSQSQAREKHITDLYKQLAQRGAEISNLQQQVGEFETQAGLSKNAAQQVSEARRRATEAEAALGIEQRRVAELSERLKNGSLSEEEKKTMQAELTAALKAEAVAEQARIAAEKNVSALSQELEVAKEAAADAEKKLEATHKEINDLKLEVQRVTQVAQNHEREKQEKEKEIDGLQREITILREMLDAKANKNVPTDATFENLIAELDKKKQELGDTRAELSKLKEENDKLRRENASLRLENSGLLAKLELKGKEIDALKADLAAAKTEIARLEKENRDYKDQVAKLRQELTDAAKKLEQQMKNAAANPDQVVEELMTESKLMKDQIIRMIRGQERRKIARQLMIEELKKYAIDSTNLLKQVDVIYHETGIDLELEKRIQKEMDSNPAGNAVPIKAVNPFPPAPEKDPDGELPLPTDPGEGIANPTSPGAGDNLSQMLSSANQACEGGRFAEAETLYQDYLRAAPDGPDALVLSNLGLAKMNLKKYDEAAVVLRDSLSRRPGDPYTSFLLGVNCFHQGDFGGANDALLGTILSDSDNAKAHHYLGVIALKQGQQQMALKHFNNAVKAEENYGTAHYNLAVLHATSKLGKDLEKAKYHYANAIENGATPDPKLEKLLD